MVQNDPRPGGARTRTRPAMIGAALAALLAADPATGADPAALCTAAARRAAAETGVPLDVLTAVMLTETGRTAAGVWAPWPWAVNRGGDGTWHDTAAAARAAVLAALDAGARNIDIGCFQLNHRWHASAFDDLDAMIDPDGNARHAARFLADLHAEFGDWTSAIGAYHSRTPALSERYAARVAAHRARLAGAASAPPAPADAVPAPRENRFPLLRAGLGGRGPSLVPTEAPVAPILAPATQPIIGNG